MKQVCADATAVVRIEEPQVLADVEVLEVGVVEGVPVDPPAHAEPKTQAFKFRQALQEVRVDVMNGIAIKAEVPQAWQTSGGRGLHDGDDVPLHIQSEKLRKK